MPPRGGWLRVRAI